MSKRRILLRGMRHSVSVSNRKISLRWCVTHGLCVKEGDIAEGDASLTVSVSKRMMSLK